MKRFWVGLCVAAFLLGAGSLALTLYLWFGDWPRQARSLVEHQRSVAARSGRGPDPLLGNVDGRDWISLGGVWRAVIDPYDRGRLGGVAPQAREPETPSDLAEFSFRDGLELEVPGDWNTQDPRLVFYQGVVWYQRTFQHVPTPERRSFLYFGAANYRASVYLNGLMLGEHAGGFTPFNFEVTGRLRAGENLLVVRVDSRLGPGDVPADTTDWLNHGGLTRDVKLVSVPRTFVRSYELQLAVSGDRLRGDVQLDGPDLQRTVQLSIPELGLRADAEASPAGRASFDVPARPERWSPETPRLYRVEIRAGEDIVTEHLGFRTLATDGARLLLNGEPVFLRGVALHEEALGPAGRAHGPVHAERLLQLALELGCNFVRLAHYPHDEAMLRAADRLGLLVWEEIPVYWDVDFSNDASLDSARQQLSELIARDRNRASVALWSVANETPQTPERLAFLRSLADHARALDSTRPVTAALLTGPGALGPLLLRYYLPALLGWRREAWVLRIDDPLARVVDVPAVNEYFGWYYAGALAWLTPLSSHRARGIVLENMDRIRIEIGVDKPLIVSEFGAGALRGERAPAATFTVFSEDYQALVYEHQIAMLSRQPGLAGMSAWVLKDFRSPLRMYQGVQDYWNLKGLVDDDGERKLAFGVLQRHYRERGRSGPRRGSPVPRRPRGPGVPARRGSVPRSSGGGQASGSGITPALTSSSRPSRSRRAQWRNSRRASEASARLGP
jgi:beta-glucuronidase